MLITEEAMRDWREKVYWKPLRLPFDFMVNITCFENIYFFKVKKKILFKSRIVFLIIERILYVCRIEVLAFILPTSYQIIDQHLLSYFFLDILVG